MSVNYKFEAPDRKISILKLSGENTVILFEGIRF